MFYVYSMQRVEQESTELQVKLQDVQKRLQAEEATKNEYQIFTEEQVITIKRLRDENFKLKKHVSCAAQYCEIVRTVTQYL